MNKAKLNFIIDIFMFICMMLVASIGFLIKFTLIPGREAWEIYGRNVDLFLFGMDRHQWGTLHLYIGFTLLGLLILHIYLHWKMIVALYRQLITSPKVRKIGCWIFIVVSIFLMVFPFLVNPNLVDREPGKGYHRRSEIYEDQTQSAIEKTEDKLQSSKPHDKYTLSGITIEVKGYMTLYEVAQRYNVPVDIIINKLGIPKSALNVQKLGKLRKMYDFKMQDIERIIYEYHKFH